MPADSADAEPGRSCGRGGRARVNAILINREDTVVVALEPLSAGERAEYEGGSIPVRQDIPRGHKIAREDMPAGTRVVKYGQPIGTLTADVTAGDWIHTHNLTTDLSGEVEYTYTPNVRELTPVQPETFMGYRRPDGSVGIRNEVWIIPTVVCSSAIAREVAAEARIRGLAQGSVEAVRCFEHPFGCSQVGDDLEQTGRVLAGLARHPNAGAVLVLSLGCEELTRDKFLEFLGPYDKERIAFITCQDEEDEVAASLAALERLCAYAGEFEREPVLASELVIGLECGGSDGLSGITANPVIGRVSDALVARGGTSVLAEVPEMFGGEAFLLDRCRDRATFDKAAGMVNWFKDYFISHHTPVYDNPSPGNKAGGITTLEDKSCGCVQKGGTAPVSGVVARYGDPLPRDQRGLMLYNTPGNDPSSVTGLAAAGCHLVLFSTGRGTPFEAPVPTLKISSNSALAERKPGWIDFDAGSVATGMCTIDQAGRNLYQQVLRVANGEQTRSEARGLQGISIWKNGVTL